MYLQSPDDAMVDTQKQNKTKQNLKCGNTGQRMPHFVERAPGGGGTDLEREYGDVRP